MSFALAVLRRWAGVLRGAWLLLPLACGCLAAPSEVELTIELGAERVEVQATLRDIQLWTEDPVEAVRAFHQLHSPEAPWAAKLLRHYPWLPLPQRWEWHSRAEALDLVLAGSMSRSLFDTCMAAPREERYGSASTGSPCSGFPLWRSGEEYLSTLEESSRRSKPEWTALGATRWPMREQRLRTRVRLELDRSLPPTRTSALPYFQAHARDPEAHATYDGLVERFSAAFRAGDTAACQAIHAKARQELPPRLSSLFDDRVRRERLWLLARLTRSHGLVPVKSGPPAVENWFDGPVYDEPLIPRQRPPELLLLKLVRLYEAGVVPFGLDWEHGTKNFSVSVREDELGTLCQELSRRAPAYHKPCRHLTGTRQPL